MIWMIDPERQRELEQDFEPNLWREALGWLFCASTIFGGALLARCLELGPYGIAGVMLGLSTGWAFTYWNEGR